MFNNPELKTPDRSWLQDLPKTICLLDRLGLLRVGGAEAEEFLSKLVSCKLESQKKHAQLCSLCNPKGRILACFNVFYRDDAIYLQMPSELVESTMQRLKMYVLTSKVELADVGNNLSGIGYIGFIPPKVEDDDTILQAPGHLPRYFVYTSTDRVRAAWQRGLDDGYTPASYDAWRYASIACGIPNIYMPTIEKLTPQMVNLDLIDAVSFSKGCYPGQEVIARTHYLGKIKRRCYLFSVASDTIKIGDPVYHPDYDEACGLVVDSYAIASDYSLALISVQVKTLTPPRLYIKTQDDQTIALQTEEMPYSVDTETK